MSASTARRTASTLILAVVGEMFDAREQHHGRCILDYQRVAVHTGRAAVANHAGHAGVAAVVHRGIENAFEDQPLLVEVLVGIGQCARGSSGGLCAAAPAARGQSSSPAAAPAARRPLHGDSNVQRLSFRGGEPLHHDVVGPRREGPANPLAALVRPVNLQLGAFEIYRAEIVFHRRGFGILQMHRESRAAPTKPAPRDGGLVPFLIAESGSVVVFSVQQHLPHLRENTGDLGCFEWPLMRQ